MSVLGENDYRKDDPAEYQRKREGEESERSEFNRTEREGAGGNDAVAGPSVPADTTPISSPPAAAVPSGSASGGAGAATARARDTERNSALFAPNDSQNFRTRWERLQVTFVDEPRSAVEEADRLVNETIQALTRSFATEREKMEQQWHRGEEASTEDLRLALRRYRSFFERLLSV